MSSYKEIAKTSSLIGGAQIIKIVVEIIKTKIFAVFLGPAGIGLLGLYSSLRDVIKNATSLGLDVSGVKFIAQANTSQDAIELAMTRKILSRLAIFTGALGAFIAIVFSRQLSEFAFGSGAYGTEIRILSICIFFNALTYMQTCILQGLRRIKSMIKATVYSCLISLIISVPLVYFFKEKSIVWVIVVNTLILWIVNKIIFSRIKFRQCTVSIGNFIRQANGMIKLGVFLILAELFSTLVLFLIRQHIIVNDSLGTVGIFQASWTLSMTYVGIIMGAMMTDFYPRLAMAVADRHRMNTLVNEQTLVALLVGSPLIIIMLVFLPLILKILYSEQFVSDLMLYQLMIASIFPRLITNPMGYILLTLNKGKQYIVFSGVFYLMLLLLTYLLWPIAGLKSIGFSFCIASYLGLVVDFLIVKRIFALKYKDENIKLIFFVFASILSVFLFQVFVRGWIGNIVSLIVLAVMIYFFYRYFKNEILSK